MKEKRPYRAKAKRPATKAARRTGAVPRARKSRVPARAVLAAAASDKSAARPPLTVAMIAAPEAYAEVHIRQPVVEASMERLFGQARDALLRYQPRRVLVDMHDVEMKLSISDLNGLAKLVADSFLGLVERLALVLRPQDLPPEKFFEPSMIHRGLPTYVSVDRNDAVDWLTARQWPR